MPDALLHLQEQLAAADRVLDRVVLVRFDVAVLRVDLAGQIVVGTDEVGHTASSAARARGLLDLKLATWTEPVTLTIVNPATPIDASGSHNEPASTRITAAEVSHLHPQGDLRPSVIGVADL